MSSESAAAASPSHDALSEFATRFGGELVLPHHADYDAARRVWNGMIDCRPAAIARCRSTDDVQSAIRFARDNSLLIAVRGGGHNAAGFAVCDDGLVIDLSAMRDVVVDASTRTARVGGGATWRDFDAATAAYGLATTGGAISSTGVGGLTLGGGLGWLMRTCGLACDNMIAADVVTADGRAIHASDTEHADLLWALRGGGGNFGIVTSFEFALHPVHMVFGGMLVYPLQWARDVLRVYRDVTRMAPDELTVFAAMMHSPDGYPLIGLALCYNGSVEDGERAIKPIRDFATPLAGAVGPMPYTAIQTMLDFAFPASLHVHWRSALVDTVDDALIDVAVAAFEDTPSPLSAILIEQLGGAMARVPRGEAAFDHRDANYNFVIVSRWADPSDADVNAAWARELFEAAKPFTNGRVYVNYIGAGEGPDRVRAAFSPEKFAKLAAIKTIYDPENVFRMNQNIPPQAAGAVIPMQLAFGDFAAEFASTRRVLERYPVGKGTWRPHEKSGTLAHMANHVADLPALGAAILETDELDVTTRKRHEPFDSSEEILALFNTNAALLETAMAKATPESLAALWTLRAGDRVIFNQPRAALLRLMVMSHLVHHRAQVGVYYRLLGIAVPGVYGPSADE